MQRAFLFPAPAGHDVEARWREEQQARQPRPERGVVARERLVAPAITYLTLGALLTRVEKSRRISAFIMGLAIAMTLLVGMSRVYLGVHWPSDVIAGWAVGAAWASLCWFVALQLQRRGQVERPGETAPSSDAKAE